MPMLTFFILLCQELAKNQKITPRQKHKEAETTRYTCYSCQILCITYQLKSISTIAQVHVILLRLMWSVWYQNA